MKCLEKERGPRDETADALALDLARYLKDEPVLACPPSNLYRLTKFWPEPGRPRCAGGGLCGSDPGHPCGDLAGGECNLGTATGPRSWKHAALAEAERARQTRRGRPSGGTEAHLTVALLLAHLDPGFNKARQWLTEGDADSRSLIELGPSVSRQGPTQEHAWKLLAVASEAAGRHDEALRTSSGRSWTTPAWLAPKTGWPGSWPPARTPGSATPRGPPPTPRKP